MRGFQADWRDAYPGINALTLMEIRDPHDDRSREILPVVRYSVTRRLSSGNPNYWDHATLLELEVLGEDEAAAADALAEVAKLIRQAILGPPGRAGTGTMALIARHTEVPRADDQVLNAPFALGG